MEHFCNFVSSLNFSYFASSFYFDCSEAKIRNGRFFIKTSSFNLRLFFLILKIGIFPYTFVQRAVQLGNISVSSKTTFSGILKCFSVILGLAVLTNFTLIIKTFVAYLTRNILKAQKVTCYLYIYRDILLPRQAGNIVHSWKNRLFISIFFLSLR